jgi:single-strand DNA-binding protein
LKYTSTGQAVCKFSIAVNRRKKNGDQWEDEANFFDIVLWGKQGESLHPYLVKGKMVGVDGELRQDRWQQEGQNRSKVEIVATYLQLLGGGPPSQERQSPRQTGDAMPHDSSHDAPSYSGAPKDDFTDDIPF